METFGITYVFERGNMKVVCIDNITVGKKIKGLTISKKYDLIRFSPPNHYLIYDDDSEPAWYNDNILMPVEKYRERQLNELGI